jgi:hypothetical protein
MSPLNTKDFSPALSTNGSHVRSRNGEPLCFSNITDIGERCESASVSLVACYDFERSEDVMIGTPVPDPDRSGPATVIVVDDSAYLVDFGPGVRRRAKAAVLDKGVKALEPANLKVAFATVFGIRHPGPRICGRSWTRSRLRLLTSVLSS